ncbi:MAG: lysophospholipid acyltransferase family protein, partial [Gemmatimonadales bacterium]
MSPPAVRLVAPLFIDQLARSWRFRLRNQHRWRRLVDTRQAFIFLLWHEALLPLLWQHRNQQIAILVSEAREGQYLADYAQRIGYHLVPGSSTRGGARALLGAIRTLADGCTVAITPDGPRGPRRAIKPGVVHAAQRAGAMILPLHAVSPSAWSLRSWDRLLVPKPFARVEVGYGEPFFVATGAAGLDAGRAQCAAALAGIEQELLG